MLRSFSGLYTVELCRAHPDKIFLFGDNLVGRGKGGQAIIRDEVNAFGVPTKVLPEMHIEAYFDDDDPRHRQAALNACRAARLLAVHQDVIVPVTANGEVSLGLGLARLDAAAPGIYTRIARLLAPEDEFQPSA